MEINKSGPPNIFRYRPDSKYSNDEIENNYIYFSNREELNDPYYCIGRLIELTDKAAELEKTYRILLNNFFDPISKQYFQKKIYS